MSASLIIFLVPVFVGLAIMVRRSTKALRPVKRWQNELAMICLGAYVGHATAANFGTTTLFALLGIGLLTVFISMVVDLIQLKKAAR
ncbi:hypothetical protein [Sphingomonas sp.]|uniref:hypothetical protein n=1 Tax=Sphingomonas sp. TaxID=28214 RepID=UPI0025E116B3|nr:hypothetical protein [Sphingomonas sp.]